MDNEQIQSLIDGLLSADEQANWHREQARAQAVDLLGHKARVERLDVAADTLTGDGKAQVLAARAESLAAIEAIVPSIEKHTARIEALKAEPVKAPSDSGVK